MVGHGALSRENSRCKGLSQGWWGEATGPRVVPAQLTGVGPRLPASFSLVECLRAVFSSKLGPQASAALLGRLGYLQRD